MSKKANFQNMSADDRIMLAKKRLPKAVSHLKSSIIAFESNKNLIHSSKITNQIKKSKATWIFNSLFRSQYHHEIISTCKFWDNSGYDRLSIPTFIDLVCDDKVISEIAQRNHDRTLEEYSKGAIIKDIDLNDDWINNFQQRRALEKAQEAKKRTISRLKAAKKYVSCPSIQKKIRNLRHLRDHSIAHALFIESEQIQPEFQISEGDEATLQSSAIKIINWLTEELMGLNYSIVDFQFTMRQYSNFFWDGVTIEVIE